MQCDPSVREDRWYATPPSEGLPGVPEGALIRLDRKVYGFFFSKNVRGAITNRLPAE